MVVATKSTIWQSLSTLILGNIQFMIILLIQLLMRVILQMTILLSQLQVFCLKDFHKLMIQAKGSKNMPIDSMITIRMIKLVD
jgi:hypothetical protein